MRQHVLACVQRDAVLWPKFLIYSFSLFFGVVSKTMKTSLPSTLALNCWISWMMTCCGWTGAIFVSFKSENCHKNKRENERRWDSCLGGRHKMWSFQSFVCSMHFYGFINLFSVFSILLKDFLSFQSVELIAEKQKNNKNRTKAIITFASFFVVFTRFHQPNFDRPISASTCSRTMRKRNRTNNFRFWKCIDDKMKISSTKRKSNEFSSKQNEIEIYVRQKSMENSIRYRRWRCNRWHLVLYFVLML